MKRTEHRDQVLFFLTKTSRGIFKKEEKEIDPYINLFELGLDSISILKFHHAIESEYAIKISKTFFYEADCLDEIAELITVQTWSEQ